MKNQLIYSIACVICCLIGVNAFATDIGGTYTNDFLLTAADSPYNSTEDIVVGSGATLSIEPGVTIFLTAAGHDIIVDGTLIALGSGAEPIFVNGTSGLGGGSLVFNEGSSGDLAHISFDNLGSWSGSLYDTGLYCADADVTADYLQFNNSPTQSRSSVIAPLISVNSARVFMLYRPSSNQQYLHQL